MNIFQYAALILYMIFCLARELFIPLLSKAENLADFLEKLAQLAESQTFVAKLTEMLVNEMSGSAVMLISALTSILALVILWLVFNRKDRNFAKYFSFKPAPVRSIFAAILLGLGLFLLVNAVLVLINLITEFAFHNLLFPMMDSLYEQVRQMGDPDLTESMGILVDSVKEAYRVSTETVVPTPEFGWFTLAAVIFAPLVEEIIFRAGPINNLKTCLPAFWTVLITSVLFSLAHIGGLQLSQLAYTLVLGMLAGYLFVKSESIYPAIICHFCFNGANLISLVVYELLGLDSVVPSGESWHHLGTDVLITPNATKLVEWYDTFSILFTIAGAVLSIPMLAVGIILLCSIRKKPQKKDDSQPALIEIDASAESAIPAQPSLEQPAPLTTEANDPFADI
jgi:membrane protease YdiL (CAAX protease family)